MHFTERKNKYATNQSDREESLFLDECTIIHCVKKTNGCKRIFMSSYERQVGTQHTQSRNVKQEPLGKQRGERYRQQ